MLEALWTKIHQIEMSRPAQQPLFRQGWRLTMVRLLWLIAFFGTIALVTIIAPHWYTINLQEYQRPRVLESIAQLGWTPEGLAIYSIAIQGLIILVFVDTALVLVWRKFKDGLALFISFALIVFGVSVTDVHYIASQVIPALSYLSLFVSFTGLYAFALFIYIFPDGRFRPFWIRYFTYLWLFMLVGLFILEVYNREIIPDNFYFWLQFVMYGMGVWGQFYRQKYISTPTEVQQMRWVTFGLGLAFVSFLFISLPFSLAPDFFDGSTPTRLALELVIITGSSLGLISVPLSITFSLLRYRLWDLDPLVNRTLVYGGVMSFLVLLYVALIFLSERLLRTLTGADSTVVIVLSTVAITVLFDPVRHRVQHFVDRRFYRRKYETERTFNAFAERLPNMVQLQELTDGLLDVIGGALQPSQLIFWLRDEAEAVSVWLGGENPIQQVSANGSQKMLKTGQKERNLDLTDPFYTYLQNHKGVQDLNRIDLQSAALARFLEHHLQYALPFISQGELIGILTFSPPEAEDYSRDEINLLNNLATQVAPAIRVAQLVHQQQAEARRSFRIEQELKVAHQTQQTLLPKAAPNLADWQIETYYQAAREVGGDFYDFIALADNRWGVVIADVTDKGVPAAMVMAATRSLISAIAPRCQHPHQVLEEVNRQLRPIIPQRMFVTCFYAILTPATGQLEFANAGHDPPHWRRQGGVEEIGLPGFPLGMVDGSEYASQKIMLSPQESLLFYSDGLVEAHNQTREMFGFERVEQILHQGPNGTGSVVDSLLKALSNFTGPDWEQEDDVTLVTLTRV